MTGKGRKRRGMFQLGSRGCRGRLGSDERWIPDLEGAPQPREETPLEIVGSAEGGDRNRDLDDSVDACAELPELTSSFIRERESSNSSTGRRKSRFGGTDTAELSRSMLETIDGLTCNAEEGRDRSMVDEVLSDFADGSAAFCDEPYGNSVDQHQSEDEDDLETSQAINGSGENNSSLPSGSRDHTIRDSGEPLCTTERSNTRPQMGYLSSGEDGSLSYAKVLKGLQELSCWQNVLSVVLVSGTVRFSVDQYEIVRTCVNTLLKHISAETKLIPSYRTVTRTLLPLMRAWGFPKTETHSAMIDRSKSGARAAVASEEEEEIGTYSVVKPSTWSSMEVQCTYTWEMLMRASVESERGDMATAFWSIERTPMLLGRNPILDVLESLVPHKFDFQGSLCGLLNSPRCPSTKISLQMRRNSLVPREVLEVSEHSVDNLGNVISLNMQPNKSILVRAPTNSRRDAPRPSEGNLSPLMAIMGKPAGHLWSEGDICTLLRSDGNIPYTLVLVLHQVLPGRQARRMELVCLSRSSLDHEGTDYCDVDFLTAAKVVVTEIRTASFESGRPYGLHSLEPCFNPSHGKLANGMKYFVDHVLLYSDGFSQYGFKQGSAGGVYCISLNYLPHRRRSRDSVRVLALTQPGLPTKEGIRSIVLDLVECSTNGVKTRNADGEEMIVFIEVVAFVCDYKEIGDVLDVFGSSGRAPCQLCSFLRSNKHQGVCSSFGYSTEIQSGEPCHARTIARAKALRGTNMPDEQLVLLGLNGRDRVKETNSPIVQYYEELNKALESAAIPLTKKNVPVVNPIFDPDRSVLVAPDHLLAGIAINGINLCFKSLPSVRLRRQTDSMICYLLRSKGLLEQSNVFNIKTNSLHTTSISRTFCTLLVSVSVFKDISYGLSTFRDLTTVPENTLFSSFVDCLSLSAQLVAKTYWYPNEGVDDPSDLIRFNEENGTTYIAELEGMCIQYIQKCNDL